MVSVRMPIWQGNFKGIRVAPRFGHADESRGYEHTHARDHWLWHPLHREIGPGVLENIYNECMQYELRQEGLRFDRERAVPLVYRGQKLKSRYYIDLGVEDRVIVELKTVGW